MTRGFLLVETAPGRERDVLSRLERLPEFQEGSVLFRTSVAVRIDARHRSLRQTAATVRRCGGVVDARLYASLHQANA
jgi:hypothetical protein